MEIVSYEMQPVEHTMSSQHKYGVHMMSPTTLRHLMNAGMTSCIHGK